MTRTVLLVDPETARQTRIVQRLDGTDFQIAATATGPEEALRLARTTNPDVALVGANLDNGAGSDLIDRLPKEHKVPVVLLASGSLETSCLRLAARAGVMGCLVEPVSADGLKIEY